MIEAAKTARGRILLAFAAVYLIWGSTYLAIRYAIETMPPFLMAGTRFFIAGLVLFFVARARSLERPTWIHWRSAAIVGGLLLLGGNGMVVWSELRIPSGMASLLIATVPLWIVILSRTRPDARVFTGIVLGFAGLLLLLGPAHLAGGRRLDPLGAGGALLGAFLWAAGSLQARSAPLPREPFLAVSLEMMAGGCLQMLAGTLLGEWSRFHVRSISLISGLSYLYLIAFGSIVGFTSYVWLLGKVAPSKVATYAYVNPVVAVFLGFLGGEPLTLRTILASLVIVSAVVVITMRGSGPPIPRRERVVIPGEKTRPAGSSAGGGAA